MYYVSKADIYIYLCLYYLYIKFNQVYSNFAASRYLYNCIKETVCFFSMQLVVVGTKQASTNISTIELSIVLIRGLVIFSYLAEWLTCFSKLSIPYICYKVDL